MPDKKVADKVKKPVTKAVPKATKSTALEADLNSDKGININVGDHKEKEVKASKPVKELSKIPSKSFYGTGKRKSAIAKVWIYPGKGEVIINKMPAIAYVGSQILEAQIIRPLEKLSLEGKYDCRITCLGGGIVGQVGACQLGIARALLTVNEEYRKALKDGGFLTRDPRVKERKKYGRKRARKGYQFRKR